MKAATPVEIVRELMEANGVSQPSSPDDRLERARLGAAFRKAADQQEPGSQARRALLTFPRRCFSTSSGGGTRPPALASSFDQDTGCSLGESALVVTVKPYAAPYVSTDADALAARARAAAIGCGRPLAADQGEPSPIADRAREQHAILVRTLRDHGVDRARDRAVSRIADRIARRRLRDRLPERRGHRAAVADSSAGPKSPPSSAG